MKKRYYNSETKEWYTEGSTMTKRVDNGVFSGIPSVEQLYEWGFVLQEEKPQEEYVPTEKERKQQRMYEIQSELSQTDYIVLKLAEGIDISGYNEKYKPAFLEWRQALRDEYNLLESEINSI